MNINRHLKFCILLAAALIISGVGLQITTKAVQAHTKCRINGPFGTWTEGCPHFHPPQEVPSQVGGPSGPVRDSRRPVRAQNRCADTLRFALRYPDGTGNYRTVGFWNLAGNSTSGNLADGGNTILVAAPSSNLYFYAYSDRVNWSGNSYWNVNGSSYGFRGIVPSNQGDHLLMSLWCDSTHIRWGDRRTATLSIDASHRWTFDATAGQWVEITMSSNNMDSYLVLYGPNGAVIASNDDGAGDRNARIRIENLTQSGKYTIEARAYSLGERGTYTLTLD